MKYSLIAFKPEKSYWCGTDRECHNAKLIRKDDLTRDEVIFEIYELAKNPEYLENGSYFYSDCPFEEFHIFKYHEEFDEITSMIDEGKDLAYKFNKEEKLKKEEKAKTEREKENKIKLEKQKAEYEKLKLIFEKNTEYV